MGPTNSPMPQINDLTDFNPPQQEQQFDATELALAAVADTDGWKILKDHIADRTAFYQEFMPGGDSLTELKGEEFEIRAKSAMILVAEFRNLLQTVEGLKDATKARK